METAFALASRPQNPHWTYSLSSENQPEASLASPTSASTGYLESSLALLLIQDTLVVAKMTLLHFRFCTSTVFPHDVKLNSLRNIARSSANDNFQSHSVSDIVAKGAFYLEKLQSALS